MTISRVLAAAGGGERPRFVAAAAVLVVATVTAGFGAPAAAADGVRVVPGLATVAEGDVGETVLEIPVSLSAAVGVEVSASWTMIYGPGVEPPAPAEPGVDFAAVSGTVHFAPGETEATVPVTVFGDLLAEPDEWIVLAFHDPVNAQMGGYWGLGFGVIESDDPPEIVVSPNGGLEGGQRVMVEGAGFRSNALIGYCQGVALEPPGPENCLGGELGADLVRAAADGTFSGEARLDRWGYVPSLGAWVDCTDRTLQCVIGAADTADIPGTLTTADIEFAPPPDPPEVRGEIVVTPATYLHAGQTVTVTGSGFRPGRLIDIVECEDEVAPTDPGGCDWSTRSEAVSDASGAFEADFVVDSFIFGPTSCETDVQCVLVAAEAVDYVGTRASAPIGFGRPPRVVPGVATVGEGDVGETLLEIPVSLSKPADVEVSASWTMIYGPGVGPPAPAEPGVDFAAVSGTVHFAPGETEATVPVTVFGDAFAEPDEWIVLAFHDPVNAQMGGYWGLGFGVIENDDLTEIVVSPSTGVEGGQRVTLEGAGFAPGATVGYCQAVRVEPPSEANCLSEMGASGSVTADESGAFSVTTRIFRWGYVASLGAQVDCTVSTYDCVFGAADMSDLVGTLAVADLAFAVPPDPPEVRGEIVVDPSAGLVDAQLVTVTGSGFRPDRVIDLYQCGGNPSPSDPGDCDWSTRVETLSDATGAFETTMEVGATIFSAVDCVIEQQCVITAVEAVDFVGTRVSAPIGFAGPPG